MEAIGGMRTTARRVRGPGIELVGLEGAQGAHTALVVREDLPGRQAAIVLPEAVRAFLERPEITGLARLAHHDAESGAFVYATGDVWSVPEVLSSLRRTGRAPGAKAALELAWRVGELLAEAHAATAPLGVFAHGAVDPWRVGLRSDGQAVLLGYGVAPAVVAVDGVPDDRVEALRYAPPERLEGSGENVSSDVFGLALVALEFLADRPVYEAEGEALEGLVREARADRRLLELREVLPADVVEVFARALRRDSDARWADARAFAEAARTALAHPALEGPGLFHLMQDEALHAPNRFLSLAEFRRNVAPAEAVAEPAPEPASRPRYVALGGRGGRRSRPALEAPDVVPVEEAAEVEAPTAVEDVRALPKAIVRRTVRLPDGGQEVVHVLDTDGAAELIERVVAQARLPRFDLEGTLVVAWDLWMDGERLQDGTAASWSGALSLQQVDVTPVSVVFTHGDDASTDTVSVSGAMTVDQVGSAAAHALGLTGTGWRLQRDGEPLAADALWSEAAQEGDTIEVVR